jgi:murein L,D-transpeptidase YafK
MYVRIVWRSLTTTARRLAVASALSAGAFVGAASALVIELKDVASDRVERQRAEAIGQLPLPGTPNIGLLADRLAAKNMAMGNPILIRVFKASSELEVWMQRGETYQLFATYPICNWSGTLGPKLNEGDKQSPEGVYTVTSRQLHLIGRHPRSLNLGFPNALDRQMSRTGSYILIHGGCGSVGCFAMTNPVIEEVFSLASAALNKGRQDAVQVHVFPFRMTEERLKAYSLNEWYDFWRNLKDVNDSFERTHTPPRITICEGRYWVEDGASTEEVAAHGPLAVCATSRVAVASQSDQGDASPAVDRPWWPLRAMLPPSLVPSRPSAPMVRSPRERIAAVLSSAPSSGQRLWSSHQNQSASSSVSPKRSRPTTSTTTSPSAVLAAAIALPPSPPPPPAVKIPCNLNRASCRQWATNHQVIANAQHEARLKSERRPTRLASRR